MAFLLAAYVLGASVLLIWTTVAIGRMASKRHKGRPALNYAPISAGLLNIWRICCSNLIIVDLRPFKECEIDDGVPDALRVAREELTRILLWLPPESKLIVYEERGLKPFDLLTESILLSFGVTTIYFLQGGIASWRRLHPSRSPECFSAERRA